MMQRDPDQQVLAHLVRGPALFARGLIQVYRHTLSGLIGLECRHLPTCSSYADEAIDRFGLWAGGWMTLARPLVRAVALRPLARDQPSDHPGRRGKLPIDPDPLRLAAAGQPRTVTGACRGT